MRRPLGTIADLNTSRVHPLCLLFRLAMHHLWTVSRMHQRRGRTPLVTDGTGVSLCEADTIASARMMIDLGVIVSTLYGWQPSATVFLAVEWHGLFWMQ